MTKHLLTATDNQKKVISIKKSITYSFNPKSNFKQINVKNVTIYDKDYMNIYVTRYLDAKYKELLSIVKQILGEDDSEEAGMRCFGLIAKYEDILNNKFKHYLKIKKYHQFIDKIMLLRKFVEVKTINIEEELEHNGRGGR